MFSTLGLLLVQLGAKINAVVASQNPILDPQHPEIMEKARYWCRVHVKRRVVERSSAMLRAEAQVKATANTMGVLTGGLPAKQLAGSNAQNIAAAVAALKNSTGAAPAAETTQSSLDSTAEPS